MSNTRFITATAWVLAWALVPVAAQSQEAFRLSSLQQPEGFDQTRIAALAEAIKAADWKRPEALFVGPVVDQKLLSQPDLIDRNSRACTTVPFEDGLWGKCDWSWSSRQLEATIHVEVVLGPSAQAAQEYLLTSLAQNMLTVEGLIATFQAAERPADLGDVALLVTSRDGTDQRLRFVRNNVFVYVRAERKLTREVLPVAHGIDRRIVAQQPLSYKRLVARRPGLSLVGPKAGSLPFQVTPPAGQRVLATMATVDGQPIPVQRNRVLLTDQRQEFDIEVIAVTQELLVGTSKKRVGPPR